MKDKEMDEEQEKRILDAYDKIARKWVEKNLSDAIIKSLTFSQKDTKFLRVELVWDGWEESKFKKSP